MTGETTFVRSYEGIQEYIFLPSQWSCIAQLDISIYICRDLYTLGGGPISRNNSCTVKECVYRVENRLVSSLLLLSTVNVGPFSGLWRRCPSAKRLPLFSGEGEGGRGNWVRPDSCAPVATLLLHHPSSTDPLNITRVLLVHGEEPLTRFDLDSDPSRGSYPVIHDCTFRVNWFTGAFQISTYEHDIL